MLALVLALVLASLVKTRLYCVQATFDIWLRSFRVKIGNFCTFFCLTIPKRDLDTKKTPPSLS